MLKPMTIAPKNVFVVLDWENYAKRKYICHNTKSPLSIDSAFNMWQKLSGIPYYFKKTIYQPDKTFGNFIDSIKEKYYIV
jgi:hypothetical protein